MMSPFSSASESSKYLARDGRRAVFDHRRSRSDSASKSPDIDDHEASIDPERRVSSSSLFLHPIQAMSLGSTEAHFEQEADSVVHHAMTHTLMDHEQTPSPPHIGQLTDSWWGRQDDFQHETRDDRRPPLGHHVIPQSSSSHPLPEIFRRDMESYFHESFAQVRIHTGPSANAFNHAMQSYAVTHGPNIYFRAGEFQPNTPSGQALLMHELTHVIQQRPIAKAGIPTPIQCMKLKGREGLEFETEEIQAEKLDQLPEIVRLHMAAVIEILEQAGMGKLWDEASQSFTEATGHPWRGRSGRDVRRTLRDQAKSLAVYRQENEPKSKGATPFTAPISEPHDRGHNPTPLESKPLIASPPAARTQAISFDHDPRLDFLFDIADFEGHLCEMDQLTDIFYAFIEDRTKLIRDGSAPANPDSKKDASALIPKQIRAIERASTTFRPSKTLTQAPTDLYNDLEQLSTKISGRLQTITPTVIFKKGTSGWVHETQDQSREFLQTIDPPKQLFALQEELRQLRANLDVSLAQLHWHQKAKFAIQKLDPLIQKHEQLIKSLQGISGLFTGAANMGDQVVEEYGEEYKEARKPKKKGKKPSGAKKVIKNFCLDGSRAAKSRHKLIDSGLEDTVIPQYEELKRQLSASQYVLQVTHDTFPTYLKFLKQGLEYSKQDPSEAIWATIQDWLPHFQQEQERLRRIFDDQQRSIKLTQDLSERLQNRQDWRSPTVTSLIELTKTLEETQASLLRDEVDLEEAHSRLEDIQSRVTQEASQFEDLLQTWQRLDRSELKQEETTITDIQKWVREYSIQDLPEVTELRKVLGDLVGDRTPQTLGSSEAIYIEPEQWQEIHRRLQTLHRSHHKAVQTQQRSTEDTQTRSESPPSAMPKAYSWLDSSTWTPSSGGIEFLNGLTQAEVEQVDPKSIPQLLKDLAELNLYGQHKHFPVVGTVYHRHILNGEGGLAFTYRLAPDMTVTPCVVDISTHRPSQGTGNKYSWQKTGVIAYNPPLSI